MVSAEKIYFYAKKLRQKPKHQSACNQLNCHERQGDEEPNQEANMNNTRKYLTKPEVERLIACAQRHRRHGLRDALLIKLMYQHGLRVSEAIGLRWTQIDLHERRLYIERLKGCKSAEHPLSDEDVKSLTLLKIRALKTISEGKTAEHVFVSQKGGGMIRQNVNAMLATLGKLAGIRVPGKAGVETVVHPHMLRHACGYQLGDSGVDTRVIQSYLGHRSIQTTQIYTDVSQRRLAEISRLL